MFIDSKDGIITTSEGQSFRKSDIYQVQIAVSKVIRRSFLEIEMDLVPNQKVFYEMDYGYSGKPHWVFTPENPDLTFKDGQHTEMKEKLDDSNYKHKFLYTKTATYEIFDCNDHKLGIHKFSKEYEDKMYLLSQWVLAKKDIKDLSVKLLLKEKTQI